jgi:hypothetical protein
MWVLAWSSDQEPRHVPGDRTPLDGPGHDPAKDGPHRHVPLDRLALSSPVQADMADVTYG